MKVAIRPLVIIVCLLLLYLPISTPVLADRGMWPVEDVTVYGPGQKAIIAWAEGEEILILSTDVYASSDSTVLEILPLPSKPTLIKEGDLASFTQIQKLIAKQFSPSRGVAPSKGLAGAGVEIVFHEKIGAHDITVVETDSVPGLINWAVEFFASKGIKHNVASPKLENVVEGYLKEGMRFFVFDLIELTQDRRSIEPILYQFRSDCLYYPLKISSLASGMTNIDLFLITKDIIAPNALPLGVILGRTLNGRVVQFRLSGEELGSIEPSVADLLGSSAWMTAVKYEGSLEDLKQDLKLYGKATLIFSYSEDKATSRKDPEVKVLVHGSEVIFSGILIPPTADYELRADLSFLPYPDTVKTAVVNIVARRGAISTVPRISEITFQGKITGLSWGKYDISINYEGRTIAKRSIAVPSQELPVFELPQEGARLELNLAQEAPLKVNGKAADSGLRTVELEAMGSDRKHHKVRLRVDDSTGEIVMDTYGTLVSTREIIHFQDELLYLGEVSDTKTINLLPDQAKELLLKQKVQRVELMTICGKPVYRVEGSTRLNLFLVVSLERTIETQIDAQWGKVIKEHLPWWSIFCSLPDRGS